MAGLCGVGVWGRFGHAFAKRPLTQRTAMVSALQQIAACAKCLGNANWRKIIAW
jgi:hypothetical protein